MRECKGEEIRFSNGEFKYALNESVRGRDVYVVQLFDDPKSDNTINDNFMAVIAAINSAKFGDANTVKAILPHFPYARQDKLLSREPLMAQLVARFLEIAGAKQVITLDIHSQAIKGYFYDIDMISLHVSKKIRRYFEETIDVKNLVVVAPDVGSSKRSNYYARKFSCRFALIDKTRDYSLPASQNIVSTKLVGEVEGSDVLIVDDMVASGGTLLNACRLLKEKGAKDIYLAVSLPFFTDKGYERFDEAYKKGFFKKFVGTDAVFWGDDFKEKYAWYEEIETADIFSEVIGALSDHRSVGDILDS